ncbi:BcBOA17 protein [Aspergillus mulundensis]|uniref:BcBOA17 protein n=1 Tax=Aspergillus mulundensis TaxID=1810919 RepID=A0A3D8T4J7_9EURO|nr:BcBOA17 protein [Aspergillus mulundensis]RDW93475.1 BcBOA17 protein [Aspergillus mulundensis]
MTGKVWFITGTSRGLGLALAQAALKDGDFVIATARNPDQISHLVEQYGSEQVYPIALDVSNYNQVIAAVRSGHERFGRIHYVVNNAGYADIASIEDITITDFQAQVNTNLMGVVYVSKAVLPILRQQKSGHIFQISSIGGRVGMNGLAAYQCAKFAVGGFSACLAQEVAPFGVKVTVLEPGGIRTDWSGSSMRIPPVSEPYQSTVGAFAKFVRGHNGSEPSLPEKIAEIVLKLTSEAEPPLRLLVGPDALMYGKKAADELAASDEKWKELSLSSTE